ncbi:alpha-L-rhamnosidase C-terminal domain-containing protein [Chitinophaga qingshengii]|uniref:Glycoside hydrolase n=1 Tax=Chitinophaga qingshengii TaxID=1569794 RepID=A0ABR7TQ63_9BACT|nr:alpha-L-rhamnosidase C-terminal domain-containing protein [Chitinophaga qingshengii]MBC9932616.1 glycoside hydrolase [Chitinophaga qingshengii]
MPIKKYILLLLCLLSLSATAQDKWTAHWIGLDTSSASNQWVAYTVKAIRSSKQRRVMARIATDSKYMLWINSRLVVREGQLKRGPNPGDTYFDEIDIGPFLEKGENEIIINTWFWGKEGFAHKNSGRNALLFQCEDEAFNSRTSWKARRLPEYYQPDGIQPNYRLAETNVGVDASKAGNIVWQPVSDYGIPPVVPWNQLVKRDIPFFRESGLKNYIGEPVKKGDTLVCRLPYNAQVTPAFKISAPAGIKIQLLTDNYLTAGNPELASVRTEYITREGEQEFETPAWMNGHFVKYVMPAGVKVRSLQYRESGYNTELSGVFHSSDSALNILWKKAQRTLYVNMRDNYFDCPDRERALWWGDVATEIGETFYALDTNANQLSRKAIRNLVDWQAADSSLYSPIPAGNWNRELPQQMLAAIHGMDTYYRYTGDTATMLYVYPALKRYLSLWKIEERGMIIHRKGGWDLPDWGVNIDASLLDNAWYVVAAKVLLTIAELHGDKAYAAQLKKQIEQVILATRKYCRQNDVYRSPDYKGETDDRANAMAVIAGIVPPEEYPEIVRLLKTARHASPYMEKYVLESLFLMQQPEAALERMKSRYQGMIDNEYTTLNELFGDNKGGTNNHAWSGGPLTLLSQYVSGVTPLKPGYSRYLVMPAPGGLSAAGSTHETVKGRITTRFATTSDGVKIELNVLPGTEVFVGIPYKEGQKVLVNDKEAWVSGGYAPRNDVSWIGKNNGYMFFSLTQKGNYIFQSF